ncbi:MAG TPA: acetylglutamate kinase [Thermoanaerobaculia bacterium]|nr:acetylglutamate kinase [Thermoanaerobaculia bacterium]
MRVIKLGGSLLDDAARRAEVLRGIARAWKRGEPIVIVHGGGKHIDAHLARLGMAKRTHAGLRITDDATLQIVVAVLGGTVNKMLVSELARAGVKAAGISGSDGPTLVAERHPPIDGIDLGNVGRVRKSDPSLIQAILGIGILPVVSSVAAGPKGTLLNVNADSAAAVIAAALGASSLVFLTDVAGLLDGNGAVVPSLGAADARALLKTDIVSGGMRPKLEAALQALSAGVGSIHIGEGGTSLVAA